MPTKSATTTAPPTDADPAPRIRVAVLGDYLQLARDAGLDVAAALRGAGLHRDWLDDPDNKVPVDAVSRLLEASAAHPGLADIGLQLAPSINVDRLGLLGFLARDKESVGAAFEATSAYSSFHNEALHIWTEPLGGQRAIRIDLIANAGRPTRQMVEMAVAVVALNFRALAGLEWRPQRVSFRHAAPASVVRHRTVFGAPVSFGQDSDALLCTQGDFLRANRLHDPQISDRLQQLREAGLLAGNDITDATQRLICSLLPTGDCTMDRVAGHLGMTSRTLHRHLAARGTGFAALLANVRREFALRHLALGQRRMAAIADLLGFRSQSDFANWFRRQFGTTPSAWVKAQR